MQQQQQLLLQVLLSLQTCGVGHIPPTLLGRTYFKHLAPTAAEFGLGLGLELV